MKMIVISMVVAVLLSSTVECSEGIVSKDLCEQICSNQLDILTMGVRGRTQDDAYFCILAKDGYMFKVALANLRVDAPNRTTTITIDREYIRVEALLDVSRDLFTRTYFYFLISNPNQDAFLGQIFFSQEDIQWAFQLYDLNDTLPIWAHPKDIVVQYYESIHVMSSIGIDSNRTYGFELRNKKLVLQYTFEVNNNDELKIIRLLDWEEPDEIIVKFLSNTDLVTVFYYKENPKNETGYYYFLDAQGLITVSRRKNAMPFITSEEEIKDLYSDRFDSNLSSFVVCHFKQTTAINWTYSIVALCIGTLIDLAIYLFCSLRREMAKRRDQKKKYRQNMSNLSSSSLVSSNLTSSNVNSSTNSCGTSSSNAFTLTSNPTTIVNLSSSTTASKASSVLQSVKSSITSLISGNKSKQAKTVAKAKNSKAKANKPKSSK